MRSLEFAKIPHSIEFEQFLQQLVQNAQQQPLKSPQRQLALSRLVELIVTSNWTNCPQQECSIADLSEDILNEALQKALLTICQQIDECNPKKSVIAWINSCVKSELVKLASRVDRANSTPIPTLEDLDYLQ